MTSSYLLTAPCRWFETGAYPRPCGLPPELALSKFCAAPADWPRDKEALRQLLARDRILARKVITGREG